MPTANIRGATIVYEVLGTSGPWFALSPGGRRGKDEVKSLAQAASPTAASASLIYDRRNCGASDVVLEGEESEYEIWADDLFALLTQLKALPAYIGGASSGCRMSLLFALRHPEAVKGLLLTRCTGGAFACNRLAENYYGQYMKAAEEGGMEAVAETEHWRDRIAANPANRARILSMDPKRFIASFARWREPFATGANLPMIGATEQDLRWHQACRRRSFPATTARTTARPACASAKLIPGAEIVDLMGRRTSTPISRVDAWDEERKRSSRACSIDFMRRAEQKRAA